MRDGVADIGDAAINGFHAYSDAWRRSISAKAFSII